MSKMKDSGIKYIGLIPDTWHIAKIKHIVSTPVQTGAGEEAQDKTDKSIRYIRISDFDKDGFIDDSKAAYISYHKGFKSIVHKGDILAATAGGTVGKTMLFRGLEEEACYAGYLANIRVDEIHMHNRFLLYQMRCKIMDDFRAFAIKKSTIENISASSYANMNVICPPYREQILICDYLDKKCLKVDELISEIGVEIQILEAYKKSLVVDAVLNGLDKDVEYKNSGIKWIGKIPKHWNVYRIADLYEDRNERGKDDLPLLTVSINSGVSDKELEDFEKDRVFIRSEDKTKYKRVYPGDLTYNMMRAWQGGMGAVRVEGMVSPAYVVAKPKGKIKIDSRFIEAVLRSPLGIEEMNRYSYGIMDFRKRLYWPQFKVIRIALPDIQEQKNIADYIDQKNAEINLVIDVKKKQQDKLFELKKSIIYEYITGKKIIPES